MIKRMPHLFCLQMTSVERVVEYTELESEAPWETQKRPPPDWPSKGLVTFDRVSFSYSDGGPLVLQSMKAMFRPKEKVGHLYVFTGQNIVNFTQYLT